MLLVLVFGGVFFTVLVALSSFVLAENRAQDVTRERSEAFGIAEAGLEHYRWFLSHFPGDTTNGTGHTGPYSVDYADPEGGTAGTYVLFVAGNSVCGTVQSIDVTSTGTPSDAPGVSATLWARYAKPSVARYSLILGASTWFEGTVFHGPMHSNGGLRMDNTQNNAPVTSSVLTWTCNSSFGCSPSRTVSGIFGTGLNQNLWSYPTPQMDFAAISASFTSLKTIAQTSGLYFQRVSTSSDPYIGYHLIFNGNNTVTVKKVTRVQALTNVYLLETLQWGTDRTLISNEQTVGTYAIPADCGVIFVEDNAWIEGTVAQKVTVVAANTVTQGVYPNIVVVAANTVTQGVYPNIVLPNNILYTAYDGSAGLTAVASHNMLIGPNTPQDLTLNGIFVAQSGAFGRNLYDCRNSAYQYRGKLFMLGTIVSILRQNNYWLGGCSSGRGGWSGYPDSTWNFVFDRQNSTNPPPFTPVTSTQWQFVDWQQK